MKTENNTSSSREFAKFGGFQFSHEMELCFAKMAKVLGEILTTKGKDLPHPAGLLLANIHQNARAILSIAPDRALNEAYLIMRVLVDTGVSFGCLLVSDESERMKYFEQPPASLYLRRSSPEQLLDEAKSLAEVDTIPQHQLNTIKQRIEILVQKTGINRDAWLIIIAAIFPHSSELLCGGPYAYARSFSTVKGTGRRASDDFCMLYFLATEFLFQIISLSARHIDIAEALANATAINARAAELIQKASVGIDDPVKGTWGLLNIAEHSSSLALAQSLAEFEEAFEVAYEAGVIAPVLKKQNEKSDFRHAALYFRRALNDFRTVWLLLGRGYTAQASTSGGSLFETCLAAICLLDPAKVQEFETKLTSATGNDFAWTPMHMAKFVCAKGRDIEDSDPTYQNLWRALYARYAWLSKIRHSTFQSVLHDTRSSAVDGGGYAVMAMPNSTDEDLPVKIKIALGALADIHQLLTSWTKASGYDGKTGDPLFDQRMERFDVLIEKLIKSNSNLKNPISIQRTKFMNRHPPVPES